MKDFGSCDEKGCKTPATVRYMEGDAERCRFCVKHAQSFEAEQRAERERLGLATKRKASS